MHDEALSAEKGLLSDTLGTVDDLVRDDKVARGDFFTQRADSGEGDNGLDTDMLERGNVGSGRDFGRRDGVRETVSRDEGDQRAGGQLGNGDRRRRLSPWLVVSDAALVGQAHSLDLDLLATRLAQYLQEELYAHFRQVVEVVETTSTNNTDQD